MSLECGSVFDEVPASVSTSERARNPQVGRKINTKIIRNSVFFLMFLISVGMTGNAWKWENFFGRACMRAIQGFSRRQVSRNLHLHLRPSRVPHVRRSHEGTGHTAD